MSGPFFRGSKLAVRKFSATGQAARLDLTWNNRDEVTEVKRYSDLAGTNLVGSTVITIDDAHRATAINHKNGAGTTLDLFSYQFDNADRVTQETSTLGTTRNYSYDDADQLLSDGTNNWTFDKNGNRTNTGYVTGAGNRLSTDGTWNFTYDDEGNTTQKVHATSTETWLYSYNHLNQMNKAEHKATSGGSIDKRIEFKYDVLGNRIEKSVDADGDGPGAAVFTRFAYEGANAWGDLDVNGSLTTRRLDTGAVDAVFARYATSGNQLDWYLTDRLGSVRDLMNNSGVIQDHIDYAGFGVVTNETAPSYGDRYKFTAREYDSELTGLAYYRGRFYRFDVGLFQSEDPIRFAAADPNLYRYVGNNPTNATDPSGLMEVPRGYEIAFATNGSATMGLLGMAKEGQADRAAWANRALGMLNLGENLAGITKILGSAPIDLGAEARVLNSPYRPSAWLNFLQNSSFGQNMQSGFNSARTFVAEVGSFAAGFMWGVGRGVHELVGEVAELIYNLPGSIRKIKEGIQTLIGLIGDGQWPEALQAAFPEIYALKDWGRMDEWTRGMAAGVVVGKYGVALLSGALASRITGMRGGLQLAGAGGPTAGVVVTRTVVSSVAVAGGPLLMAASNAGGGGNVFQDIYDSFQDAVGQVQPLTKIQKTAANNPGAIAQGFTEHWRGRGADGRWYSAFHNPTTGKFAGGHSSSHIP